MHQRPVFQGRPLSNPAPDIDQTVVSMTAEQVLPNVRGRRIERE